MLTCWHPNIVTVHDFEIEGDYAYLVMEFAYRPNSSELLAQRCGYLTHAFSLLTWFLHCKLQHRQNEVQFYLTLSQQITAIDRCGTVNLSDSLVWQILCLGCWWCHRCGIAGCHAS